MQISFWSGRDELVEKTKYPILRLVEKSKPIICSEHCDILSSYVSGTLVYDNLQVSSSIRMYHTIRKAKASFQIRS